MFNDVFSIIIINVYISYDALSCISIKKTNTHLISLDSPRQSPSFLGPFPPSAP